MWMLQLGEAKNKSVSSVLKKDQKRTKLQRQRTDQLLPGPGDGRGEDVGVTKRGNMREIFVVMGQFCILIALVVPPAYTDNKVVQKHTHCSNVNFLILTFDYSYVKCNHWEKLDEGHKGPLYTVLATFCEGIMISKFKKNF